MDSALTPNFGLTIVSESIRIVLVYFMDFDCYFIDVHRKEVVQVVTCDNSSFKI
jgi:hypothetical protein